MRIFDLTKEIKLELKEQKKYNAMRAILHVAFVLFVIFAMDRILLPNASQDFYFNSIGSSRNTISNPRIDSEATNGTIAEGQTFTFNASRMGTFSSATTTFITDKKIDNPSDVNISLHKSYQAFFYPIGQPTGFKNGSLLTTSDGKYYIVSGEILRKFSNTDIILSLGYPKNSFQLVEEKDLQYNKIGPEISTSNTYPDGTLFAIDDTYYQLNNQQLLPFISARAFLSQYDEIQAIVKSQELFSFYPKSENSLGFANGTLASADTSVYILSEGKSYPIANAETFLSMGFKWEDIIALASEELGFYEKQKQFNQNQPHPNGTLFLDQKTNESFVIDNGSKRPIKSSAVMKNYAKQKAIIANQDALTKSVSCALDSSVSNQNKYSCTMLLEEINQFPGSYYQIDAKFPVAVKLTQINETLSTPFTWNNIRIALGGIKNTLRTNYTQQ